MTAIDWKMAIFILSGFQFIFTTVIFSVIKFNDLKHLDEDVRDMKKGMMEYEKKNDERHLQNVEVIGGLAKEIAYLSGKFETIIKD